MGKPENWTWASLRVAVRSLEVLEAGSRGWCILELLHCGSLSAWESYLVLSWQRDFAEEFAVAARGLVGVRSFYSGRNSYSEKAMIVHLRQVFGR